MLTLDIREFMIQFKEGTINNVGGPTKSATVKLFDVVDTTARAFGDQRIKLTCVDTDGNEVVIALSPEDVECLEHEIDTVRESDTIDGLEPDDS